MQGKQRKTAVEYSDIESVTDLKFWISKSNIDSMAQPNSGQTSDMFSSLKKEVSFYEAT